MNEEREGIITCLRKRQWARQKRGNLYFFFWLEIRTKEKSSKGKICKKLRQMEKRRKSALNDGDVNFESVPETPACCQLITVPVPYNTLAAPSAPSLSSLHSPTHIQADSEGEIGRGTLRWMCSTSCTCLQIVVIFSVLLWSRLFDEMPGSGFPRMIKSAFKRYTCSIWNRPWPCALTTATVGCFGFIRLTQSLSLLLAQTVL